MREWGEGNREESWLSLWANDAQSLGTCQESCRMYLSIAPLKDRKLGTYLLTEVSHWFPVAPWPIHPLSWAHCSEISRGGVEEVLGAIKASATL